MGSLLKRLAMALTATKLRLLQKDGLEKVYTYMRWPGEHKREAKRAHSLYNIPSSNFFFCGYEVNTL
jgi:hypothetical protein